MNTTEMQWAIIEIKPCETFGKVGNVVGMMESKYLVDAAVTGMERMQFRGEMPGTSSFMYCDVNRLNHAAASYGFKLNK